MNFEFLSKLLSETGMTSMSLTPLVLLPRSELDPLGPEAYNDPATQRLGGGAHTPDQQRMKDTVFFQTNPDGIKKDIGYKEHPELIKAQLRLNDAYSLPLNDHEGRIAIAREVLKFAPLAADAWCLLAEHEAKTVKEALKFYKNGEEAGKKAINDPHYDKRISDHSHKGQPHWIKYWDTLITRPFMRAKAGVGLCLFKLGRLSESRQEFHLMADHINFDDNQGMRIAYALNLFELGRSHYRELRHIFSVVEDNLMGSHWFNYALLCKKERSETEAVTYLKMGIKRNKHILPLLMSGKKPLSPPICVMLGDELEAQWYVYWFDKYWEPSEKKWAQLKSGTDSTPVTSKVEGVEEGLEYMKKAKNWKQVGNQIDCLIALDKAKKLIPKDHPKYVDCLKMRSEALKENLKAAEAVSDYWEILERNPEDVMTMVELATAFEAMGHNNTAVWAVRHALVYSNKIQPEYLKIFKEVESECLSEMTEKDTKKCGHCDRAESNDGTPTKSCGGCKKIYYCSRQCQKDNWVVHKAWCKSQK